MSNIFMTLAAFATGLASVAAIAGYQTDIQIREEHTRVFAEVGQHVDPVTDRAQHLAGDR